MAEFYSAAAGQSPPLPWTNLSPPHTGGCGLATLAGISALFLGTDSTIWPIVVIFVLAQSAFLLDAADGQLARCTNNTSKFGAFLDHGLDIFSTMLVFGGFFAYLYRYYASSGDIMLADLSLLVGFMVILSSTSRFFAAENFANIRNAHNLQEEIRDTSVMIALKNVIDHQVSLFTILIFLLSPGLCFAIFTFQASFRLLSYFRIFLRAYRLLDR